MEAIFSFFAVNFDLPILDWIAGNLRCAFLDFWMPIITLLGDAGIFWIITAVVLLIFPKYRKAGLAMGAALLMGLVVCNITLKPLMARPRPYDFVLENYGQNIQLLIAAQHDFSFPSGHTLASFEAATALLLHHKRLGIAAMILAVIIAFTRLYLYVHYPTDVLFSVGLGVAFGFLGKWLVGKGYDAYDLRKAKH